MKRHGGESVDGFIGVELQVDAFLNHDSEDPSPNRAGDRAGRTRVGLALGEDLAREVFDVASFGADVLADPGADLFVVEADADQLDIEGVGVGLGA